MATITKKATDMATSGAPFETSVLPEQSTTVTSPLNGYDLPLFGLDDGEFYSLHVPAVVSSYISIICAVTVVSVSFYHNRSLSFFRWNKGERLVVYLEICDTVVSSSTALSRMHILLTEEHVNPSWLCVMYAFSLILFLVSQALMVNAVAVNAFMLMHREHDFNFGRYDYRLLLHSFGIPVIFATYVAASGQFGPNGIMCTFDGVRSKTAGILTSMLLLIVCVVNSILYIITWFKIKKKANSRQTKKAVSTAAKTMSMFVAAFFFQWALIAVYCVWKVFEKHPPMFLMKAMASLANLGGLFNGCVYVIIRWQKLKTSMKEGLSSGSSQPLKNQDTDVERVV